MNSRGKCDTKQFHLLQLRAATGQNVPTQDESSLRLFKICVVPYFTPIIDQFQSIVMHSISVVALATMMMWLKVNGNFQLPPLTKNVDNVDQQE